MVLESLKVVDVEVWRQAKKEVLAEIYKALIISIRLAADEVDQSQGVNLTTHPEQCLGGGHLWQALCALAQRNDTRDKLPIKTWPDPVSFQLAELQQRLPNVRPSALREVLKRLAASPALEGIATETDRYQFAYHLLPMWLRFERGDAK